MSDVSDVTEPDVPIDPVENPVIPEEDLEGVPVIDAYDEFTDVVREALADLEATAGPTSYLYVQSVIIADCGKPVARLRWDGEAYEYRETRLTESDGR